MRVYLLDSRHQLMAEPENKEDMAKVTSPDAKVILCTPEEFRQVKIPLPCQRELLHSLSFEKYSKVEYTQKSFIGMIRSPGYQEKRPTPFSFGLLMENNTLWLISAQKEVAELMEQMKSELPFASTLHDFVLLFFNHLIQNDMIVLQKIEEELELLEEKILKEKQPPHFNELILQYRRKLSRRHGYYVQLMNIGDYMQSILQKNVIEVESGWDLFTHRVERLHGYVEQIREHLVQIKEMYQTQVDLQQNKVVTFLTVVTTIFLPLSLMTGWYGMNFTNMPELEWKYGYLIIIVLSIVIIGVEIHYFKKKKML